MRELFGIFFALLALAWKLLTAIYLEIIAIIVIAVTVSFLMELIWTKLLKWEFTVRHDISSSVAVIVIGIVTVIFHLFAPAPFDAATWKDAEPASSARMKMLHELVGTNSILIGKTRSEVLDLLGPPDQQNGDTGTLIYALPAISYMGVSFDTNARVVKVYTDD